MKEDSDLEFQRENKQFPGRQERAKCDKFLLGHSETAGHREVQQTGSARFLPPVTLSLHCDVELMLPSFKEVFLSEFL